MAIEQLQHRFESSYSKEQIYASLGVSRQRFHKQQKAKKAKQFQADQLIEMVIKWRKHHPQMGARVMYKTWQGSGLQLPIGINQFERLLAGAGLNVKKNKPFVPRTTDSRGSTFYPNQTNGLIINGINQLIVSDLTYFWCDQRWCYIFCFKDVYSQRIIDLIPTEDMEATHLIKGLDHLVKLRSKQALEGCIFHSDNGSQYNASDFIKQLNRLGMTISRAEVCIQNGSAEQLNHIIKNMYLIPYRIQCFKQLKKACKKVVKLCNEQRAVKQLGYRTPAQFEEHIKGLTLNQKPIKKLYDFNKT